MHTAHRIAAAFVLIGALPTPARAADAPAQGKPTVATVIEGTLLEGRERDILAGKKVTVEALQSSRREMSAALACLIPPGRKGSLAHLHNAEAIMPDEYRDASGPIDVNDLEGSLASLTMGKSAEKEAKRYLGATPGWGLSLSSEEIAAFNALDPPKGQEVAAVEAELARQFAKEWARQGVNVNTIQPGWIHTEINDAWYRSEESRAAIAGLPRRRMQDQSSLDDMVLYLCSDRSRFVTGATFTIDDGQSL